MIWTLVVATVAAMEPETQGMLEGPDPGVAMGLSICVGFGAGHFYGRSAGSGAAFLLAEGLTLGMVYGQLHAARTGEAHIERHARAARDWAYAFGALRLVDPLTAAPVARASRDERIAELRGRQPMPAMVPGAAPVPVPTTNTRLMDSCQDVLRQVEDPALLSPECREALGL